MLHQAIFFCLQCNKFCIVFVSCQKIIHVQHPILQTAMQQNVALRVARKIELSSTFSIDATDVATCDMSITMGNTVLLKLANESAYFARERFQNDNFQWARCKLQCLSVCIVALSVAILLSCRCCFWLVT